MSTIARPVHRWTGSKHDLLDQLRPLRPRTFGLYFEPFVGAGGYAYDGDPRDRVTELVIRGGYAT